MHPEIHLKPHSFMGEFISDIFGSGSELTTAQMGSRALVMFFICLLLIRIAGRRSFGTQSAFDNIIVMLLGSILSRAVAGVSPFLPTVFSCLLIVICYRLLGYLSVSSPWLAGILKGRKMILYANGAFDRNNLKRNSMSEHDVKQWIRDELHSDSLKQVDKVYIETNGKLSVIKADEQAAFSKE